MIIRTNDLFDQAITEIISIGKDIRRISVVSDHKHPFDLNYISQIISKWRDNPGKRSIHLWDLPDHYKISFSNKFNLTSQKVLCDVKSFRGLDSIQRETGVNFYLLEEYLWGRSSNLTVKTLKRILSFLEENEIFSPILQLERNIISISPGRKSEPLKVNGLPLDLTDEKWSPIIGIILDTCLRKEFLFASIDDDLSDSVRKQLLEVGINPYFKRLGNLTRIKGHNVVRDILSIAGINMNEKQVVSNNCLPWWIFKTSANYQSIILAKFLDTEGSVDFKKRLIRFSQSTRANLRPDDRDYFLKNCRETVIKPGETPSRILNLGQLNTSLRKKTLLNPPLILVSSQLLLRKRGINSFLYPTRIVMDSNQNFTCQWNLHIQSNSDIRRFYDLCKDHISIRYKKERIETIIKNVQSYAIPAGLRRSFYLLHADKLESEWGHFNVKDMIQSTHKSTKTVQNEVALMERNGLIQATHKKGHTKFRKLTDHGKQILENEDLSLKEYEKLFSNTN